MTKTSVKSELVHRLPLQSTRSAVQLWDFVKHKMYLTGRWINYTSHIKYCIMKREGGSFYSQSNLKWKKKKITIFFKHFIWLSCAICATVQSSQTMCILTEITLMDLTVWHRAQYCEKVSVISAIPNNTKVNYLRSTCPLPLTLSLSASSSASGRVVQVYSAWGDSKINVNN